MSRFLLEVGSKQCASRLNQQVVFSLIGVAYRVEVKVKR